MSGRRGLNLSSKNRNAIREHERGQDSQARLQKRLERKMEARQRKLEGQSLPAVEVTIEPQQIPDEPTLPAQPCVTRFWEFLRNFRGPERF